MGNPKTEATVEITDLKKEEFSASLRDVNEEGMAEENDDIAEDIAYWIKYVREELKNFEGYEDTDTVLISYPNSPGMISPVEVGDVRRKLNRAAEDLRTIGFSEENESFDYLIGASHYGGMYVIREVTGKTESEIDSIIEQCHQDYENDRG